jgi:hypothetical protein
MVSFIRFSTFFGLILVLSHAAFGSERAAGGSDSYDVVLHSQSLADQRAALTEILENPQKYAPRIQQSLRDYPRLLRTDPTVAKRAVYISALLRDPSFPPILVKSLGTPEVLDDCIYACPVVFALAIQAYFGGWKLPTNLDSELTTVGDLKAALDYMPRINLKPGTIEDVVQGPGVEKHRKEIAGKTEEELIRLAGPMTSSGETRTFAAYALETSVSGSKNRIELYLLALNDFEDASSEYREAVYQSIFRAELATRQESSADSGPVYVGLIEDDRRELTHIADGHNLPGHNLDDPVPSRNVVPYFVKDGARWEPIRELNQNVTWTITFDGKNLGQVESQVIPSAQARPKGVSGPQCVHKILTPLDKVPQIKTHEGGPGDPNFNGNYGVIVRRPLVVVSKPNFADPDRWKRTTLPDEVVQQVRAVFQKTFSHVRRCDSSGEPLAKDSRVLDSEIAVLKAYGSKKGSFIVETQLTNHRCVYNMNGAKLQLLDGDQWYYATPTRDVVFLARDWELIDAGDYDGDGRSEVIFYIAEAEADCCVDTIGYVLFYDDFQHSARFAWSESAAVPE